MAVQAEHEEILQFIDDNRLMGKELGYVDMHLSASAILSGGSFADPGEEA